MTSIHHDSPVTTTDPESGGRERLASVLRLGFVVTLVVFLLGGFVLVGAQAYQLVVGDGPAVAAIGERLGPPTFVVATICGLFAFLLDYFGAGDGEHPGA